LDEDGAMRGRESRGEGEKRLTANFHLLSLSPTMSSPMAEIDPPHKFPLIDIDPHFKRVVAYFRPSGPALPLSLLSLL
jgi:hypothetical protein